MKKKLPKKKRPKKKKRYKAKGKAKRTYKISTNISDNYRNELISLGKSRTIDDRRTLVGRLLAQGWKRADLIRHLCPDFNCSLNTIDADIAWAKDWMLKGIKEKSQEQKLSEIVATADEIVRQAFNKGDLQVANASNKHRAELFGLTRERDEVPIIPLGVILLPAQEGASEWVKKAKAHKPKR